LIRERIMKIKIDDLAKRENILPCTRKLQYFIICENRAAKWRNEYVRPREIIGMRVNGGNNS